jgi:hypothetical protein
MPTPLDGLALVTYIIAAMLPAGTSLGLYPASAAHLTGVGPWQRFHYFARVPIRACGMECVSGAFVAMLRA